MKGRRDREQRIAQKMATCRHFNGVQHDRCEAGLDYHDVHGHGPGCFKALACLSKPGAPQCARAEFPTRAEAEVETDRREASLAKTFTAMAAAHEHAGKRRSFQDSCFCPCEKAGTLKYTVASNGHMACRCSCGDVAWME